MGIYYCEVKKEGLIIMKCIEIDAGMYAVKAKCGDNKFYCRMLVAPLNECATDNGYKVEYCNRIYMVGEESIPMNYDYDKKRIENKIATYLAISRFIEKENEKVNVIIGMPLEHWLDRERRQEFENYFKSALVKLKVTKGGEEKTISFGINQIKAFPETIGHLYIPENQKKFANRTVGLVKLKVTKGGEEKTISFGINQIKAFPETIGHLYIPENQKKFANRTVGILDCGGCNFQGAIYRNMVPVKESCFTSNKGVNFYLDEVKRAINNKFGTNYQIYQIDDLIKFGAIGDKKELIAEEIKKVTRNFLSGVFREAKARNWMIEGLPVIITGGGSCYFVEAIDELLRETTISNNEVWDNVDGFGEIGGIVYGRKEVTS